MEKVIELSLSHPRACVIKVESEAMDGKYKRSVLRRQSRDTNQNIKRSVYCQYG